MSMLGLFLRFNGSFWMVIASIVIPAAFMPWM